MSYTLNQTGSIPDGAKSYTVVRNQPFYKYNSVSKERKFDRTFKIELAKFNSKPELDTYFAKYLPSPPPIDMEQLEILVETA